MKYKRFSLAAFGATAIAFIHLVTPVSLSENSAQTQSKLLWSYYNPGPSCELEMVLDLLTNELTENPEACAYAIVYTGAQTHSSPGLFRRHSLGLKNYLINAKQVSGERLVVIDGGRRERFQTDVWVVPKNGIPPQPAPDPILKSHDAKPSGPYDEYSYNPDSDMAEYLDSSVRLDGFAKALLSEPSTVGYIIGYGECLDITEYERIPESEEDQYVSRSFQRCDRPGAGRKIASAEQRSLSKLFGIASSKVAVIDGGYRNSQRIELWVVPIGEEALNPTPTAYRQ